MKRRRQQAWLATFLAGAVWSGVFLLVRASLQNFSLWPLTAMTGVLAAWLAWQAFWLHHGRKEWRIESGRLVYQRRFGSKITELAETQALELTESRDSDGDRWYRVEAIVAEGVGQHNRRVGSRFTINCTIRRSRALWGRILPSVRAFRSAT